MTIMVIVIGVVAPSLKGFVQGRDLDHEARRFLSLTHFGLARAVNEGNPVELWMDARLGRYGLGAVGGYTETRTNGVSFFLDNEPDVRSQQIKMLISQPSGTMTQSNYWTPSTTRRGAYPIIRFQPDGFISDSSPPVVVFRQGLTQQIRLVENPNHTRYDIQIGQPQLVRF